MGMFPKNRIFGGGKKPDKPNEAHPGELQAYLDMQCQFGPYDVKPHYIHTFPVRESRSRKAILEHVADSYVRPETRDAQHVHVGAAGFFNLDMAVRSRADACVFIDINPNQIAFWKGEGNYKGFIAMLRDFDSPEALKRAFETKTVRNQYLNPEWPTNLGWDFNGKKYVEKPGILAQMNFDDFTQECPSLRGEDGELQGYAHLHQLATSGRMAAVLVDITNAKDCKTLHDPIASYQPPSASRPFAVGHVYSSNILELLTPHWNTINVNHVLARAEQAAFEKSNEGRDAHMRDAVRGYLEVLRKDKPFKPEDIAAITDAAKFALAYNIHEHDMRVENGMMLQPHRSLTGIPSMDETVVQRFYDRLMFGNPKNNIPPVSEQVLEETGLRGAFGSGFRDAPIITNAKQRHAGVDALAGDATIYMGQTSTFAPAIIRQKASVQPAYPKELAAAHDTGVTR